MPITTFPSRVRALRGAHTALALLVLAVAIGACEGTPIAAVGPPVTDVLRSVATPAGQQGVFETGSIPAAGGGAVFTVSAPPAAVVGGTALYTLSSTTPFQQAFVTIDGYQGYFNVSLPTAVTSVDLLVTFRQEQLFFVHTLAFNGVAAGGGAGQLAFATTRLISVGTGDVQVSVFFDSLADLDLYVVDPTGEEIYYQNKQGTHGTLDLDANLGCTIDNPVVNNENITFPTGQAQRGTYTVRLNYWSSCGRQSTRYVVTVAVKGQLPMVFTGTFTGTGTGGGAGAGRLITQFTY